MPNWGAMSLNIPNGAENNQGDLSHLLDDFSKEAGGGINIGKIFGAGDRGFMAGSAAPTGGGLGGGMLAKFFNAPQDEKKLQQMLQPQDL